MPERRNDAVTSALPDEADVDAAVLQWVRAGSPGDWAWWCSLTDDTRAAFAAAGDQLMIEQAAAIAHAMIVGPKIATAPLDNGEAVADDVLDAWAARVAQGEPKGAGGRQV